MNIGVTNYSKSKKDITKSFQFTKVTGLKYKFGAHVGAAGGMSIDSFSQKQIANSFRCLEFSSQRKKYRVCVVSESQKSTS